MTFKTIGDFDKEYRFGVFWFGAYSTKDGLKDQDKLRFFRMLQISGTVYFLSFPACLLLCNSAALYN